MYNFLVQAYATYKGLFYWLTWPSYISNVFLSPIVFVMIYSILGRFALGTEAARYYGLGIVVHQMTFLLIGGITQTYSYDRNLGTMAFLYISPINRLVNFLSRPVLHYPNALFLFTTGLITLWLLADIDFNFMNWTVFVTAVLVTAASIAGFAQFISIFTIVTRDWLYMMTPTVGLLFAFTGVIIPIDVFPPAIQEFSKILPVTNGLSVIRAAFSGVTSAEVYLGIMREALTGLVYLTIGFAGFVLFEHVVKRTGTLEIESM